MTVPKNNTVEYLISEFDDGEILKIEQKVYNNGYK